jgi:RimJ/RimL family protein N-acetyltransferase
VEVFLVECKDTAPRLILCDREDDTREQSAGPQSDLGYVLHSDYHGQGYASDACRAVLAHAFERLQAQRVVSGTAAANHTSCRLLERLGFQKTAEGTGSFRTTADGRPITFLRIHIRAL